MLYSDLEISIFLIVIATIKIIVLYAATMLNEESFAFFVSCVIILGTLSLLLLDNDVFYSFKCHEPIVLWDFDNF